MATQPTSLPVPSESLRDLKFNAGKIDEFVTSLQREYEDRFGKKHYTIEGLRWVAQQAIAAFGYITLDSFEDGNTLTLPNQVLRLEANGEYYRWDGAFPKTVPADSTPDTTGGIGPGKWLSVGDAALRQQLASDSESLGDALVTTKQPFTGAKKQTVHTKLAQVINVLDFDGVVGDGVNDDTAGIQAAIDATPWGGELIFNVPEEFYKVSADIIISKPIIIRGNGGSSVTTKQFPCIKAAGSNSIFKMRATLDNYMFSAYGITGIHIKDIMLEGPALNTNGVSGICTDETINGGVYHVRNNTFTNVNIRYFDHGWNIRGICYLNSWNDCRALWCSRGCVVDKVSGASEGGSDQNRFFGCEFVLCDRGLSLSEEGYSGSQTIVGCTLSEGLVGLIVGFNTTLHLAGNQIESNDYSGVSISIPSGIGNPASEGIKNIVGNCFILNQVDISVDKQTTAFAGGFAFPVNISANTFSQTVDKVLYVNAPTGAGEFDSRQFVLSSTNAFSPAGGGTVGLIPDSKISSGWKGYNGFHEDGKVTATGRVIGGAAKNILRFDVPAGKQCYVRYDMSSLPDNAADGSSPEIAAVRFTNVTDSSVLVETIGTNGTLLIPRVDNNKTIVVALWANNTTNSANATISYCIH
ncbi:tail fiber/spike domain-containing protein [Enterobacter bugandensis]|uniref:tail fiber/spike domain-containing protein n=1 Tax=Enterobacter bugandensis TaxID=881260 RepID=UPI00079C8D35|nr:glycosyl hydrolase family 28-related protein [Enterobacter bugandensis]SAH66980.1 T7 tail fiber protein [Enterobacter bugandensis]